MPVSPATLTPGLTAAFSSTGIVGVSALPLANGIASAFTAFLKTIPVTTIHVGVLGAGTGTGKVTLTGPAGVGTINAALTANGIVGTSALNLAQGVARAIALEMNTNAVVQVVIAGSSTGTGTGTLAAANPATLTGLLATNLPANGIAGTSMPQLAAGLGQGIATWLQTALINTVDVGSPAPPFNTSTGAGTGVVF